MTREDWSQNAAWVAALGSVETVRADFKERASRETRPSHSVYFHAMSFVEPMCRYALPEGPEGFAEREKNILGNTEIRPDVRKAIAEGFRTIRAACVAAGFEIPSNKAAYELVDSFRTQDGPAI